MSQCGRQHPSPGVPGGGGVAHQVAERVPLLLGGLAFGGRRPRVHERAHERHQPRLDRRVIVVGLPPPQRGGGQEPVRLIADAHGRQRALGHEVLGRPQAELVGVRRVAPHVGQRVAPERRPQRSDEGAVERRVVVVAADDPSQARPTGQRRRRGDCSRLRPRSHRDQAAPGVGVARGDGRLAVDGAGGRARSEQTEAATVGLRGQQRARVATADADDVEGVDVVGHARAEVDLGGQPDPLRLGERCPPRLVVAVRVVQVEVDLVGQHRQRRHRYRVGAAPGHPDLHRRRKTHEPGGPHGAAGLVRALDRDLPIGAGDRREGAGQPRGALRPCRRGQRAPGAAPRRRLEVAPPGRHPHRLHGIELDGRRPVVVVA